MTEVKAAVDRFNQIKSERGVWNNHFQILGEYISQNKQNFETTHQPGEFLTDDIYDSTGTFAAHNSASALLGMLWPGSAKQSIEIVAPEDLEVDGELAEFYKERMTGRTIRAMDDPKANLMLSLDEYMIDQMIFGTSGVGVEKGDTTKLLYAPYGVKQLYIEEGKGGRVDEEWLLYEWRLSRVVDEYGVENLSEKTRKKFEAGKKDELVKILNVIRPREAPKAEEGILSMPIESLHIEFDSSHLIKESGFNEQPINVGRFRKLTYEKYGRSPGMMALPDIREANALREAVIIATEKALNMPKGVFNDGVLGGGVIDTSANAINVFNDSGGGQPIFDIGLPPDIGAALNRLEELKDVISQHFHIDRLLDFNNDQEMTFGEAQIRNQIRTASLSSLFSRQITEVLTPTIERSVNILFREGEYGVARGSDEEKELLLSGATDIEYIPDALVKRLDAGESIYEVRYKTQAVQAARAEDYIAILETVNFMGQAAQIDPSVVNRVDLHEAIKEMGQIRSLPPNIIRQDDEVTELEEAEQEQLQASRELEQAEQVAGIAKDVVPLLQKGK